MTSKLTEEEMRRALGLSSTNTSQPPNQPPAIATSPKVELERRQLPKAKARTPKLRVTLSVSKEFEGETTLFHHDAATLSRFDAEQQAVVLAKKEKYRYFEVVDIKSIE